MAIVPNQWLAYVVGVGLGVASITFLVSSTAIVQLEAAPEMRGRVLALQAMLFLGSTPIGGPIVGWVSDQFGARVRDRARCRRRARRGRVGLLKARPGARPGRRDVRGPRRRRPPDPQRRALA